MSNTGSYTNWVTDFNNLRCTRTVNNSYTASYTIGNWTHGGYKSCIGRYENTRYNNGECQDYGINNISVNKCTCYEIWGNNIWSCPLGGNILNSNGYSATCNKIDTEYKAFSSF
ncbi:hypothetical protein [Aliarcobacter butzleri]|uniref:hypothetical protein n=1 Tax=Aliarcobacter butzleri TaxID=28197 RepID=UPI002B24372A|nr:hypothetical protein [Aliarcobacter butzleri]